MIQLIHLIIKFIRSLVSPKPHLNKEAIRGIGTILYYSYIRISDVLTARGVDIEVKMIGT